MVRYSGNKIYDYINEKSLNDKYVYFSNNLWALVYGNKNSIPKSVALVSKIEMNMTSTLTNEEKNAAEFLVKFSEMIQLPFFFIRYVENEKKVQLYYQGSWEVVNYDDLRNHYEKLEIIEEGSLGKSVNQYLSSGFHEWQRQSLGNITVSDIDLFKVENGFIKAIFELKRSKYSLDRWAPFRDDYPNFALLINSILRSNEKIEFILIYNCLLDGELGQRIDDITFLKIYHVDLPDYFIEPSEVYFIEDGQVKISDILF